MGADGLQNGAESFLSRARIVIAPIVAVALGACSGAESSINEPRARLTPAYVTGAAAAAVGADGRFRFADAVVNPPGQVNEQQAKAIAKRFVKDIAWMKVGDWTHYHGATIQVDALTPCDDRALYAATPYASISPGVSELVTRTWGPHWVVPLCGGRGQAQVVVSFSALATELAAGVAGADTLPWSRGDLYSTGVPLRAASSLYSPEAAAIYAYRNTGRRVSTVPELIMAPRPESPIMVRWRLDLESEIGVKGTESGVSRQRTALFVGFKGVFLSSGMLDINPNAAPPELQWVDLVTRAPFTAVLAPHASPGVELVTREQP